ncbi:Flp pilus assembly protein CpaB [Pseudoalteromonas sp. 2CM28B]|uniref:Flp pilus assembly protein CpaB n=1 Tax=Pseudoalteromonas sp. 2CM28B TaxID=2929851 RepID=UPI0020BD8B44|nr:Flp pilus assembly protein CpaB [Pseudoalteromonas sp. 2CM28B]MCK8136602.1 Flp pilus assembly protein CpaB [Pseudoalteromonas sp. 2CM28B]
MKIRNLLDKNWVLLIISLILGVAAAWSVGKYIESKEDELKTFYSKSDVKKVPVIVVTKPLFKGTTINKVSVAVREIPTNYLPAGTIHPSEFAEIDGQMLLTDVSTGQPLLRAYLPGKGLQQFSDILTDGRRAVTIQIDETNSTAGLLVAGDKVDLYLLSEKQQDKPQLELLIESVNVLATGQITADKHKEIVDEIYNDPTNYSTLTLDVSVLDAARVSLAKEHGKFVTLLKNRQDKKIVTERLVDSSSLFKSSGGEDEVEMIFGGSGAVAQSVTTYIDKSKKTEVASVTKNKL